MMRYLAMALFLFALAPTAHSRFLASPLEEVFARASESLDVEVLKGEAVEWADSRGGLHVCGFVYEARVNEALKGSLRGRVTFVTPSSLGLGARYLLFLDRYDSDFPTDVFIKRDEADERKRQECISSLPSLKASWLHTVEFLSNQDFVALSDHVVAPKDISAGQVAVEQVRYGSENLAMRTIGSQSAPEAYWLLLGLGLETTVVRWEALRAHLLTLEGSLTAPRNSRAPTSEFRRPRITDGTAERELAPDGPLRGPQVK